MNQSLELFGRRMSPAGHAIEELGHVETVEALIIERGAHWISRQIISAQVLGDDITKIRHSTDLIKGPVVHEGGVGATLFLSLLSRGYQGGQMIEGLNGLDRGSVERFKYLMTAC